jgi:hypothetical protein
MIIEFALKDVKYLLLKFILDLLARHGSKFGQNENHLNPGSHVLAFFIDISYSKTHSSFIEMIRLFGHGRP